MGDLPLTSKANGSVPYDEGETEVTFYLQRGKHHQIDVDRLIWWCHREFEGKRTVIHWLDSTIEIQNEQSKTTEGTGQAKLRAAGSPDDPLPPDDAGSVPGGVPAV